MNNIHKQFLTNTDHTGRFVVTSARTGRKYFVEPIGKTKTNWGDVQSYGSGVVTGSYGQKYRGSIDEDDSLITEENGFKNIRMLDPGTSPLACIEQIDSQYPDKA
jgi:hypothetical protein